MEVMVEGGGGGRVITCLPTNLMLLHLASETGCFAGWFFTVSLAGNL